MTELTAITPTGGVIRGAGFMPGYSPAEFATMETGVTTQWALRGLLTTTGQWVNIETYQNQEAAEIAFTFVRVRSRFSDKVHIRDFDAFSVFAIEPMVTVVYKR